MRQKVTSRGDETRNEERAESKVTGNKEAEKITEETRRTKERKQQWKDKEAERAEGGQDRSGGREGWRRGGRKGGGDERRGEEDEEGGKEKGGRGREETNGDERKGNGRGDTSPSSERLRVKGGKDPGRTHAATLKLWNMSRFCCLNWKYWASSRKVSACSNFLALRKRRMKSSSVRRKPMSGRVTIMSRTCNDA